MKKNKVVIVGTGMVGMSYAYSMVNQGTCEELVLIDLDKKRAEGEAIDLNHGLSFAPRKMNIYAGDYSDCKDAYLICITAGAIQLEGETRLDLLHKNTKIMKSIVNEIKKSGFDGIILVAANPVDIMTYVCWKLSGYDKSKVIGSGTTLDSARLMYTLGERLDVNPKDINAYVIGEHGALTRITKAILENENSVLTVSSYLNGEYGHDDVYIAVPSIVNENGVREVIHLPLDNEEKEKLDKSVEIMKENINKLDI